MSDAQRKDETAGRDWPDFMGSILFEVLFGPLLVLIFLPAMTVYGSYRFAIWLYENELKKPEGQLQR